MSERKAFRDLSKSQQNRRLRAICNSTCNPPEEGINKTLPVHPPPEECNTFIDPL